MARTNTHVQLPVNSTGEKLRMWKDGLGDPSADVLRQIVVPSDREGYTPGDGDYHGGAIGGVTTVVGTEFTRPANATAYAIGDCVNNSTSTPLPITLAAACRISAGSGYITSLRLVSSVDAALVGVVFRVWLFNTTPSLAVDNAAFASDYTDRSKRFGVAELSPMIDIGNDAEGANYELRIPFKGASGTDLFAVLETRTAFTPGSAQTFHLFAGIEQN